MKKNIIFYTLILFSLALFILGLFKIPNLKTSLYPIFPPVYNTMNVILDTTGDIQTDNAVIKTNDGFFAFSKQKNILNKRLNKNVKSVEILISENAKDKIKGLIIFNEIKVFYFKNFNEFEAEKTELCPDKTCQNYTKYKIDNIKYNKNFESLNFHSVQNALCVLILSLFSGSLIFFIPWVLVFVAVIYFLNNRNEISLPKIKALYFTPFLFIFAILMFSNGIFDYLPWVDEYRTIEYSDPKNPLSTLFSDPGNPPLFYFLFRIFIGFFGISIYTMKIFPFLISIGAIIALWLFIKDRADLKTANIAVFLAAINVPFVYYALETRCYILQMLMTPVIAWVLFKILEGDGDQGGYKKYFIYYAILVAIASNIHYFEILFLVSNFIFVSLYFLVQKKYKNILWFFMANAIGALFFLPFFILTAYNKALVDPNFNNWIPPINIAQIKKCTFYIFGGFLSVLLSAAFFIKTVFEKENSTKKTLIIYSFFVIVMTIMQGVILSYAIRPMLVERYLVLLSPLFVTFLACLMTSNYKKQWVFIFFIIWIFYIQANSFEKNNRRKGLIELPMSFSKQYYAQNGGEVYSIINFSNPEYLENKKDYMDKNIHYVSRSVFDMDNAVNEILNKDKNAVIFTNAINPDKKSLQLPENYKCYFNSSIDMCLWKITGGER